jgi:hypothetical protein
MPDARSFATDEDRQNAMAERGAAYLEPLLPKCAIETLVGGERSCCSTCTTCRGSSIRVAVAPPYPA